MLSVGLTFTYSILAAYIGYNTSNTSNDEVWMILKIACGEVFYPLLSTVFLVWAGSDLTSNVNI